MSSQPAGIPARAGTPVLPTPSLPFAAPTSAQGKSPGTVETDVQHFENLLSKVSATTPRPDPNADSTAAARPADSVTTDAATPEAEATEEGERASVPIRPRKTRSKESEASDLDKLLLSLAFVAQPPPPQTAPVAPIQLSATATPGEILSEEAASSGSPVMAAGDALIPAMRSSTEALPLNETRPQPRGDAMSTVSDVPRAQTMEGIDSQQTPDDGSQEKKGDWIEGLKPEKGSLGKNAAEVLKEGVRAAPAFKMDMEKVAATSREAGIAGLDLIGKAKVTESARRVDAGRSSTAASPGGTWSAQQSSDVTAVDNTVAEATPAKAPTGARFGRGQGALSPTDLAPSVSGTSSGVFDVAHIPQEMVEVTSVKEPREVMLEHILDHAATVRQSGHDSLGVTIRANDRTEIVVHFKYVDGIVHAQAQLERGDLGLLSSQWQDLQTHLARQGVNLSALNSAPSREGGLGQNPQNGQGQSRQFTPGDSREGQGWTAWNAGSDGGRGAAAAPSRNAATDRVQRNLGLLETWA